MRKKGVHADVDFLVSGLVLNFAIFYMDGVHRGDRDLCKLRSAVRNLKT